MRSTNTAPAPRPAEGPARLPPGLELYRGV